MMILIKDLFADKVIRMQEGSNIIIHLLLKADFFKQHMKEDPYSAENNPLKAALKVLVQAALLVWEFVKRLVFVFVTAWLPWKILAGMFPLIAREQGLTIVYIYFILSTLCGTITNSTIFTMSSTDSFLLNTAGIDAARYYFGRILYRMFADAVFGGTALMIAGVQPGQAYILSLITALARPVGEVFGIVVYMYFKKMHSKKALYDGVLISAAIIAAYAIPYAYRKVPQVWNGVVSTPAFIVTAVLSAVSLYIIWNYKGYPSIVRELIFSKREDFN